MLMPDSQDQDGCTAATPVMEMSLEEWVGRLPEGHRAHRELAALKAESGCTTLAPDEVDALRKSVAAMTTRATPAYFESAVAGLAKLRAGELVGGPGPALRRDEYERALREAGCVEIPSQDDGQPLVYDATTRDGLAGIITECVGLLVKEPGRSRWQSTAAFDPAAYEARLEELAGTEVIGTFAPSGLDESDRAAIEQRNREVGLMVEHFRANGLAPGAGLYVRAEGQEDTLWFRTTLGALDDREMAR